MNALDSALVRLAAAATALEHHRPDVADVEQARDHAKAAAKILTAAFDLMTCGVYSVADPPPTKFEDPADHTIHMPEIPPSEPTPAPWACEALRLFDGWDPERQEEQFNLRVDALGDKAQASGLQFQEWENLWVADRRNAWLCLVVAEIEGSFEVPAQEQVQAYLDGERAREEALQIEAEALHAFEDAPDDLSRRNLWEAQLSRLEEGGVEQGLKRKAWKSAREAWEALYTTNPTEAYQTLRAACAKTEITWEVPTSEVLAGDPLADEGGVE